MSKTSDLREALLCCRPSPYVVSNNLGGGFGEGYTASVCNMSLGRGIV